MSFCLRTGILTPKHRWREVKLEQHAWLYVKAMYLCTAMYVYIYIYIYIWKKHIYIYLQNVFIFIMTVMTHLHLICDMFQMMKCWTTRPSISEAFAEPRADHRTSPRVEPVQRRRCGRCISLVLRFIAGFAHLEIKHKFKVFCKSWVLISGCVGHVCSMISTFCNEYLVCFF